MSSSAPWEGTLPQAQADLATAQTTNSPSFRTQDLLIHRDFDFSVPHALAEKVIKLSLADSEIEVVVIGARSSKLSIERTKSIPFNESVNQ